VTLLRKIALNLKCEVKNRQCIYLFHSSLKLIFKSASQEITELNPKFKKNIQGELLSPYSVVISVQLKKHGQLTIFTIDLMEVMVYAMHSGR